MSEQVLLRDLVAIPDTVHDGDFVLQAKAARLGARLDPEGVQARKDEAKRDRRVELRREDSGAASLAGRELDPAEALAGKASIDAEAVRLRNAGLPGALAQIRAMILMDRIHQRSPWDRLAPLPEPEPEPEPGDGRDGRCGGWGCDGDCDGICGDSRDSAASRCASWSGDDRRMSGAGWRIRPGRPGDRELLASFARAD